MVLEQKTWDDLTKDEKKSVSNLLFKKGTEIIKDISEGEPEKIIEMLLNKGKDYGDPSFKYLFEGEEFKIKEFKTIPVNPGSDTGYEDEVESVEVSSVEY